MINEIFSRMQGADGKDGDPGPPGDKGDKVRLISAACIILSQYFYV